MSDNSPSDQPSTAGVENTLIVDAKAQAAALVTEAVHTAEEVVHKATRTAEKLLDDSEERTTKALADALREVFGENQDARRFVDITKIPLICQSINGIHLSLTELKIMMKDFDAKYASKLTEKIVFALVGLIVLGFMGSLASGVFNK